MEKLKFALVSIIALTLLGLMVYWAVGTIQTGSEHVSADKIKKLENENGELKIEVDKLKNELGLLQADVNDVRQDAQMAAANPPAPISVPPPIKQYKNQPLINELQKLIDENIVLKVGSRNSRVSTIQKFLNIYNNNSNKIDNDFGASTQSAIIAFQKDQGLSGDGEAGKTTFSKMIDWLKEKNI